MTDKEKKQRVLHARIPESLDAEIKSRAESLGISVSNLVRNVLQNTFEMVGEIVADATVLARQARPDAGPRYAPQPGLAPPAAPSELLGWQPLVLSVNALCEQCNAILPKSSAAHVAVRTVPGQPQFRCNQCVKEPEQNETTV